MLERTPSYEDLEPLVGQLRDQNCRLTERVEALEAELAEARQAAARQAAPFRRREGLKKPAAEKKRPGRAPGHEGYYRPRPEQIDDTIEAPLPGCPHCHGELSDVRPCVPVIEELPPVTPRRIKLTTWCGNCPRCGEVRSTHPLQTSTAVGAAGTHLGPRAQALATCWPKPPRNPRRKRSAIASGSNALTCSAAWPTRPPNRPTTAPSATCGRR